MTRASAERGQIVAVEVLLLLGVLIVAFGLYQAFAVPTQNAELELDHNQDVQWDLQNLRASLLDIHADETHRPVPIQLGTRYPFRIVAINPPSPGGHLSTNDFGHISFENVEIVGEFEGNPTQQLLEKSHETKLLTYEPHYHEYRGAPSTIFEHSLLYNRFEDGNRAIASQQLVKHDTRTINIVLFEGELSEAGFRTTLHPTTLDGPTEPLPIRASTGDTFDIVLPTATPDLWTDADVIGATFEEGEPDVAATVTGDTEVTLTINATGSSGEWTLQVTKVGYDGGEKDDVFSSIKSLELDPVDVEPVFGPLVTLEDEHLDVSSGDEIDLATDLEGEITSVGSDDHFRSGTPIQVIKYDVIGPDGTTYREGEVYADFDPDSSERTFLLSEISELATQTTPIDTTDWEEGEHTISVYAQDASGRITHNQEIGTITVEIVEEVPPALAIRVDDLTHVRDDSTMFLTSVSITDESETFERIEVVHQSIDNPWAVGQETITSPRGSVVYEEAGTAGDDYEITVRVIHSEEGEDVIAHERTISAVADASNPIAEDVSLPPSPHLDESEIIDRSNPWDGVRYRISYEVGQTEAFAETRSFLVSTEAGGFDSRTSMDEAASIDLETDGYGEEFKIAILLIDDDGVVVDAHMDFDRAEETSAGNTEIVSSSAQEPQLPGNNPASELALELAKDGPAEVTIEGIAFEETSSVATVIEAADPPGPGDGAAFIRTDTGTVLRSDPIQLGGGETSVTPETFQQWETPEFVLTQFRDEDGNQVDMADETVTIRLYFADGSSRSYELVGWALLNPQTTSS